jgi:hypothetical protein
MCYSMHQISSYIKLVICLLYCVITVHLFTVTIQLDATLFKELYSFFKHI